MSSVGKHRGDDPLPAALRYRILRTAILGRTVERHILIVKM